MPELDPMPEVALPTIQCTSSPTEVSVYGPTKSNKLWEELSSHRVAFEKPGGRWHVKISRHRQAGGTDTLDYYTDDSPAPPNAQGGTSCQALVTRTVADFHDPSWTSPTGDLFTAWIGEDEI